MPQLFAEEEHEEPRFAGTVGSGGFTFSQTPVQVYFPVLEPQALETEQGEPGVCTQHSTPVSHVCVLGPTQSAPPFAGAGLVQVRV